MKHSKSFEEQAFDATEGMDIEEIEMALKEQDSKMTEHMLETIGEAVNLIQVQGEATDSLNERVNKLEESVGNLSESMNKLSAKMQVMASMISETREEK